MKTVFSYLKPYQGLVILALFLMFLELAVELIQPLLIAKIIDDGILANDPQVILELGIFMVVISFVAFFGAITNTVIASHIVQSYGYDIR